MAALAAFTSGGSMGQPVPGTVRVGVLGVTSASAYAAQVEALREGFRDLAYIEGRTLHIEFRWADGRSDRLPRLAAELVALRPDVLISSGIGTRVLKEATNSIPIVMAASGDAVASGLVASFSKPGGTITGSTFFGPEIAAKRVEILKEAVPRLARVAVFVNPDNRDRGATLDAIASTASALRVQLLELAVAVPEAFADAISRVLALGADGLVIVDDSVLVAGMRRLGGLAFENRIPSAGSADHAEGGGLVSYGVDFPALWRRAASFVDRIVRGAPAATIPLERATKFELVVSRRTARHLGLSLPSALLARANATIE